MKTQAEHEQEIRAELAAKMDPVENVWHGQVLADVLAPRLAALEAAREQDGARIATMATSLAEMEGGTAESAKASG
jgi:hypothetical protein